MTSCKMINTFSGAWQQIWNHQSPIHHVSAGNRSGPLRWQSTTAMWTSACRFLWHMGLP